SVTSGTGKPSSRCPCSIRGGPSMACTSAAAIHSTPRSVRARIGRSGTVRAYVSSSVGPAAVLSLVRQRNFGPYFVGNALSASGGWFQNLAASLLVYRLTHSAFLLGVLNFCQFAPVLLLAPWTGSAADRFNRRRLLLCTQLVSTVVSATLAALAFAGAAGEWV